ncbi:MAG: hypothetical protein Q8K30_03175 [Candidatus Gracilibacteria bacterium]|nr:hypothetical protein [Candidatus Gracilibacteria bacterium]
MIISSLNNLLNTYSYTYDEVGNITSDNKKNYTYDDIYIITQTNDTNTTLQLENFAYDNVGIKKTELIYN